MSLAVNLSIGDSTWLPTLFAVGENIDRTFNLNHTYVLLDFNSDENPKREHVIQIVLQVPHPHELDSFPEYDCHIFICISALCGRKLPTSGGSPP